MNAHGYIDLAASVMLLSAIVIAATDRHGLQTQMLRIQGISLSIIPLVLSVESGSLGLALTAVVVIVVRGIVLPLLVGRAVAELRTTETVKRGTLSANFSLLASAALAILAIVALSPLYKLAPGSTTRASTIGLALFLIGVQILVSRRQAISQVVGFLVLDNGISAIGILAAHGLPVVLEIGASLDLLFIILILGALTTRMFAKFGSTDVDALSELRDR